MEPGKSWSSRRRRAQVWLGLCLCLLAGCATGGAQFDRDMMAEGGSARRNQGVAASYLLACPDALDLQVAGRTELSGERVIAADGCIDLGSDGRVRVEGLPLSEAAHNIAERVGVRVEAVTLKVTRYESKKVYLYGEVEGLQRAVAYQGPETVLDLLQRTGGITTGAELRNVHVLRPHVTDARPPEVYQIDLSAIVHHRDQRTNIRLQPFDQIHVGETRQSNYAKCIPPCLRGFYKHCCGLTRE